MREVDTEGEREDGTERKAGKEKEEKGVSGQEKAAEEGECCRGNEEMKEGVRKI